MSEINLKKTLGFFDMTADELDRLGFEEIHALMIGARYDPENRTILRPVLDINLGQIVYEEAAPS